MSQSFTAKNAKTLESNKNNNITSSTTPVDLRESASIKQQQESILLELEIILSTVKQIDSNLVRSIDLLHNRIPINTDNELKQQKTSIAHTQLKELDYNELIKENTESIKSILEALDGL